VVLGAQWGDEGKGKLVDILAQDAQVCARFNGGANAGHTLIVDGKKYAFHLLPCGMINRACKNIIGNGVVVHIPTLMKELDELKEFDPQALERVFISTRAHILLDSHQIIDGILEAEQGTNSIGTTKRGIGPCYSSKAIRNGVRFGDLLHFDEFVRKLKDLTAESLVGKEVLEPGPEKRRKRAPASGYMLFINENFARVRQELADAVGDMPGFSDIAKEAAAQWRSLPRADQTEYHRRAAAVREAERPSESLVLCETSALRSTQGASKGRVQSLHSFKRKWMEQELAKWEAKLKQEWEAFSSDEVTAQLMAWRVRGLSGTDEFKKRLGSTLDALISQRMAEPNVPGLMGRLGLGNARLPHPAALKLEWEAKSLQGSGAQLEAAVAHCLRSFREMPPRSLVPWWSIIASRARRQEECLRRLLCSEGLAGSAASDQDSQAILEWSDFEDFRGERRSGGLRLPGRDELDPLWELLQEEEYLTLSQALTRLAGFAALLVFCEEQCSWMTFWAIHPASMVKPKPAWSQKRYSHPRDKDSPAQLQLRQALREYNTQFAFDPEKGAKGGVKNLEEEIERYRRYSEILRTQIVDSVTLVHGDIALGAKVLVEGANAALLDIDFGTYPFVTSSNTTVGSVCTGLGVPPKLVDTVIGVVKAYTTRVGHGPFPTELQNEMQSLEDYEETFIGTAATCERKGHSGGPFKLVPGQPVKVGMMLQEVGAEYGTTTGRRRRCGWLDLALVKYSAMVNGFDSLNITKLDVLTGLKQIRIAIAYRNRRMTEVRLPSGYFPSHLDDLKEVVCEYETLEGWSEDISKCTSWEALPENAKKYVLRIEELLGIPVSWVGVGPDRSSMLKIPTKRRRVSGLPYPISGGILEGLPG
ncbi:unnamed protein product, partial [Effrenium voratum]